MFSDECMVIKYVQFGSLFAPFGFLCQGQRYQIVSFDTVLQGFQDEGGRFVNVRSGGCAA